MDFGSPSSSSIDPSQREQLMESVKQQVALANAQEILQRMSEKCFKKCITKPGSSLDNSEQLWVEQQDILATSLLQKVTATYCRNFSAESIMNRKTWSPKHTSHMAPKKCIAMCMDRYMDSWNLVSRVYSSRLSKERSKLN